MFSFLSQSQLGTRIATCTLQNSFPSQTPIIYSLSQYSSAVGAYTVVNIFGANFVYNGGGGSGASTEVYMTVLAGGGTGTKTVIPTTFYNSSEISFVVPSVLGVGAYRVAVAVKSTVPGGNGHSMASATLLFSNTETYTLT